MYIIFVGSKGAGYFIDEEVKRLKGEIEFVESKAHISEQINTILPLAKKGCTAIIYDAEQYVDSAEIIAAEIEKVHKAINAKAIVLASTANPNNVLIRACLDHGIKEFINIGLTITDQKDQFIKCVTDYYKNNPDERQDIRDIEKIKDEEKKRVGTLNTIGVVGSMHRIGTTTQCIQIAKYINYLGYTCCIIEMNENKYINKTSSARLHGKTELSYAEKTMAVFGCEFIDDELGIFKIEGVTMLFNKDKFSEILKAGYDFLIYDYGVFSDIDFNKTAFLKDDLKFIVVGTSVTEIDITKEIASNISYQDAKLIFNFIPEIEKNEVLSLMDTIKIGDKSNTTRTFMTDYTPDPFTLTNLSFYNELLSIEEREHEEKKHRGFSLKRLVKKNG